MLDAITERLRYVWWGFFGPLHELEEHDRVKKQQPEASDFDVWWVLYGKRG